MRSSVVILACFGLVAASNCPIPAKLTTITNMKGRYAVKVEVKSKVVNDKDVVFELNNKEHIKAPLYGSLWAPRDYYIPSKITVPKTCKSALQALRVGQTYIAIGEQDQYHLVRNFKKLEDAEKKVLEKLRG